MKAARALVVALLAAVLLLGGALLGLVTSASYAPGRLAGVAERVLSEALGPVRVGSVHLAFDWGPALELREVHAVVEPEASPAALSAARVRIGFDLRPLFQGALRAARVEVTGLHVTAVRTPDGALHPPAIGRLLERSDAGGSGPRDLQEAIAALRERAAGLPSLALDDVTLRWRDLDAASGDPLADSAVRGGRAALRHSLLTGRLTFEASGRLVVAGSDRGGFELDAELPALGAPHGDLALAGLDLALAQPWLARWAPARTADLALAGRLGAHLRWRSEDQVDRIELELLGLDLGARGRTGPANTTQEVELPSARLSGTLGLASHALAVEGLTLSLGPLELVADARARRPLGGSSAIDLDVRGKPLAVATLRAWLRAAGSPLALRAAESLASGRLTAWALHCKGTRPAQARAAVTDLVGGWPEGCFAELAVEGLGARLGDGPPLEALHGRLRYGRDRLELRGVRGRLGDEDLPTLDLELAGLGAVRQALREGRLPDPVPPLPGWNTLETWARGDRKPGAPSRWQRADVAASRLAHPALLRPIAGLRAVVRPVPNGWDAQIEDGWWGSARIAGRARKSGEPPGRIEVEARARSDGGVPPADRADPEAWFRGSFRVELNKLGPFRARSATGSLRIEGARGEITGGDAELVPRGRLVGEVDLALDEREFVPASGRLRIEGGSVPDLLQDLSLDGGAMTGTAHLSGDLSARLIPRENILRELTGPLTLKLRDGEINQRMNLLLAIAAASDTFNPFRSRKVLPYEEVDGALAFDRGVLRAEALSLVGPAVRLVASGGVNVIEAPYELEAVAGVFFFRTLDAVISRVPLVNRLLLGKDDNLLAAWFALTGPWVDPEARVLPQTLLTSGPMGIVTEGVPGFVRSGVETLVRLLGGGGTPAEPRRADRRQHAGPGARQ